MKARGSYIALAQRLAASRRMSFREACAVLGRRGGAVAAQRKAARRREVELQEARGLR